MFFSLEALEAKHGDALILYYGEGRERSVVVIDGGPHGVYVGSVRRRLESLRPQGAELPIPLMMISHLDEDHIQGILELTHELTEMKRDPRKLPQDIFNRRPDERPMLPYRIDTLWFNGFDKILNNRETELEEALTAAPQAEVLALSTALPASVAQGLKLTHNIEDLGLTGVINFGFEKLVESSGEGAQLVVFDPEEKSFYPLLPGERPDSEETLRFTVLGPSRLQLQRLHAEWDSEVERLKKAADEKERLKAAEYLDKTVFNLSSIVVLAEAGGKSMLLTGDARGDFIIESAEQAGLLPDGSLHVDLLKLPHHGSDRNVDVDFFTTFTADHYVISANGKYDNPSLATFDYLFKARDGDERPFTIYLTNDASGAANDRAGKARDYMEAVVSSLNRRAEVDSRVTVVYRQPDEPSVLVDLANPVRLPLLD